MTLELLATWFYANGVIIHINDKKLQFIYYVNSHGSKTAKKNHKKVILPTITSSKCQRQFGELLRGNSRDDRAYFVNVRYDTPKNWRILSNISGYTESVFAISSPYESALRADDGSVPCFPIYQGTLPWQLNNVAIKKANWYYMHSLHVCQMVERFCFATTCYGGRHCFATHS